jgi:hypothetical protein
VDGGVTAAPPIPLAVVCTRSDPHDRGVLYRDGTHRYIVWRDGHNDAVTRDMTEYGIPYDVVSRGKRAIAEEVGRGR